MGQNLAEHKATFAALDLKCQQKVGFKTRAFPNQRFRYHSKMERCAGSATRPIGSQQGPTRFLQCQRCKGFILSETSTVKRMHNVKCLSYAVEETERKSFGGESNWEVFQGFVPITFRSANLTLPKLSDEEIRAQTLSEQKNKMLKRRKGRPKKTIPSTELVLEENHHSGGLESFNEQTMPVTSITEEKCKEIPLKESSSSGSNKSFGKRLAGRPVGVRNRDGVELGNIIWSHRSRNSEKAESRAAEFQSRRAGKIVNRGSKCHGATNLDKSASSLLTIKRRGRPPGIRNKKECTVVSSSRKFKSFQNSYLDGTKTEKADNCVSSKLIQKKIFGRKLVRNKIFGKRRKTRRKFCNATADRNIAGTKAVNCAVDVNNKTDDEGTEAVIDNQEKDTRNKKSPKNNRHAPNWRPRGVLNRSGIDLNNIIDAKTSRKSCIKAKAKFKEISLSASEENDNDTVDSDDLSEIDSDSSSDKHIKDSRGRKRKYLTPLTSQEKYLFYIKKHNLEDIRAGKFRVRSKRYLNGYLPSKKVICAFCKERVREHFLEMHVTHFHTDGHDQATCECDLRLCIPLTNKHAKITCNKCGRLIRIDGIRSHMLAHENGEAKRKPSNKELLYCAICQTGLTSYKGIKAHFISFHMEKSPFSCKYPGCNYKGGEYYHLERHVGKHLRENKLECQQCGSKFSKLGSLVRHRQYGICPGYKMEAVAENSRKSQNKVEKLLQCAERDQCKDMTSEKADTLMNGHVKSESVINIGSIDLHDQIIETEHGPVHIKGETLDASVDANDEEINKDSIIPEATADDVKKFDNDDENVGNPMFDNKPDLGTEWNETRVREAANNLIFSWDDKLQDVGYINSAIRADPLFQKLQEENPEFTEMILRRGGRTNYFSVHKSSTTFIHRCNICSLAFRRGWALARHKKLKVCQFMAGKNETNKESDEGSKTKGGDSNAPATNTVSGIDSSNVMKPMELLCAECGFKSDSPIELEEHMKSSHKNNRWKDKKHLCPRNCGAAYNSRQQLNKHIDEVHLKERSFKCTICQRGFTIKRTLQLHTYNVHKRSPNFFCKQCGKTFQLRENYDKHVQQCNVEERRPKCHQCNEHFSNKKCLRRHVALVHVDKCFSSVATYNGASTPCDNLEKEDTNNAKDPLDVDNSMILGI